MYISKVESLKWIEFFSEHPDEDLLKDYEYVILNIMRQIERTQNKNIKDLQESIKNLQSLKGRSFYIGSMDKFPKGCISCLLGTGLGGVRKTNTCNLKCKFCYYHDELEYQEPVPDGMWDIGDNLYEEEDIDLLLDAQGKPSGIAYVYLEPFVEIEKYYNIVKKFSDRGIYQHMYTNGTLCTEENLKELGRLGLDELRFNLGASKSNDDVIAAMKMAKKYIPQVGIETPMTPEFFSEFLEKKDIIRESGIDFINCAEFHLGPDNINNYSDEKLYVYRNGYISPTWSREITYKIMKIVENESWDIVVHDCSNSTKYAREINKSSKNGEAFGAHNYYSEFDRFIPHIFLNILKDENFKFLREEEIDKEWTVEGSMEDLSTYI